MLSEASPQKPHGDRSSHLFLPGDLKKPKTVGPNKVKVNAPTLESAIIGDFLLTIREIGVLWWSPQYKCTYELAIIIS